MTLRRWLPALGALALPLSAVSAPAAPLAWDFDARAVCGEVSVLPLVAASAELRAPEGTWVGAGLGEAREQARRSREATLSDLPNAIADAIPGAISGQVGPSWGGAFTVGRFPLGARRRVAQVLGDVALGPALSELAARSTSDGTLFVWVSEVHASPLSAETFAGDIVELGLGPVVVDHHVEPYRVQARVGAALVAQDGEVVVRYSDTYDAALTDSGPHPTARAIATQLAREVALVWPSDPRLQERYALVD